MQDSKERTLESKGPSKVKGESDSSGKNWLTLDIEDVFLKDLLWTTNCVSIYLLIYKDFYVEINFIILFLYIFYIINVRNKLQLCYTKLNLTGNLTRTFPRVTPFLLSRFVSKLQTRASAAIDYNAMHAPGKCVVTYSLVCVTVFVHKPIIILILVSHF